MKAYVILANSKFAKRPELQAFLDQHPQVSYWYACFPNSVFAISDLNARQLAKELEGHFSTEPGNRFFVLEVNSNRQGRLPKELWALLRNPQSTPVGR